MYNIFGYFKTCDKQSEKLNRGSYQYTTRDYVTIYFNNTLASFSRSLREFKEKAYGFMYDIGTWLKEIMKVSLNDLQCIITIPQKKNPLLKLKK